MKNKAAIIIVNWNGLKFLDDCLTAVFDQIYKNFDVYFVDNGSKDSSVKFVESKFPKVEIIKLDKNYGFAEANNIGIRQALYDKDIKYLVFLNNDTKVEPGWLASLVNTAEMSKNIGMVSSKALFPNGTIQNAGLSFEKGLVSGKNGGLSLGYGLPKNHPSFASDIEIFAPGGVACLYKREVIEEVGLFDEDFFAYAEDYDLGFRARLMGWKSYLSAKAQLVHYHSQTGGDNSLFKLFHTTRNIIFVAYKNLPIKFFLDFFLNYLKKRYLGIKFNHTKTIKTLKNNNNFSYFRFVSKLIISMVYYLPKMTLKRNKIQRGRRIKKNNILEWYSRFSRNNYE